MVVCVAMCDLSCMRVRLRVAACLAVRVDVCDRAGGVHVCCVMCCLLFVCVVVGFVAGVLVHVWLRGV